MFDGSTGNILIPEVPGPFDLLQLRVCLPTYLNGDSFL